MRVLIATGLYPPDIGGPATYSKILKDELPKRGVDVRILSFGEVRHLPKVARHLVYFLKCLKQGRYVDVIYAQDPVSVGLPALLAAKFLGKEFVLKVVGDYAWEQYMQKSKFETPEKFQTEEHDWSTELRRRIQKFVARSAEKIIVPSEYLKKIVSMWGVSEDKIKVVNNSFEAPAILESKEDLRRDLGLAGKILISVGRLVPWKGFDTLIKIMPEILKEEPDVKLYIIGSGPELSNLKSQVADLGLESEVFLLGQLPHDKVISYLVAGDVFILNTGYEGLSHLLLEAMYVGLPIITTNIGGNPELIENNQTGILVDYNNAEGIKRGVKSLLNDKLLAERVIKNSKEKILKFGKEKMLAETIASLAK